MIDAGGGPRAGRGVLLFALGFPTLLTWAYFILLGGSAAWLQQTVYGVGKAIQFGLPLVWVLFVLRRPVRPGLPARQGLFLGAAFGLAAGALIGAVYAWGLPAATIEATAAVLKGKIEGFGIDTPAEFAAMGVAYSLAHSLAEEYYWRWFVFGELDRSLPRGLSVTVGSLGFAAHHVVILLHFFGASSLTAYVASAGVAVGGAAWAWLYARTGSLYAPWLSHALVDAAIFTVGYDMVM